MAPLEEQLLENVIDSGKRASRPMTRPSTAAPILTVLAIVATVLVSCAKQPAPPILPAPTRITAHLHSVPDIGIKGIGKVEIPQDYIEEVLKIVTPVTFFKSGIRPDLHYHVADVYLHHESSNTTTITVRYTGHNPAAVTVDGVNYFYASIDGPIDGATGLANLLAKLHFEAERDQQHDNPRGDP